MKRYLVDASIILQSILEESNFVSKEFEKIMKEVALGKARILSQKFLIMEVANGIRYAEKDKILAQKYFQVFLKLPIKYLALSKSQYKQILEFSYELGTTVYDTSYHILAISKGAIFLTCDSKYFKKAKGLGSVELVG
jgi:predicted nucleic acid-binding protein